MNLLHSRSLYKVFTIIIAVCGFTLAGYSQVTVSFTDPVGSPLPNPSGTTAYSNDFKVKATVTGSPTSVVFYRNDVPYETVGSIPWEITEQHLGQETYTYRAKAYYSSAAPAESNTVKMAVQTPRVLKMGDPLAPVVTNGPLRYRDHTEDIKRAIAYLSSFPDGGTLFFPCTLAQGQSQSYYSIRETIDIPANITIQGESSEQYGACRIYWMDVSWFPAFPTPTPPPSPDPEPTPIPTPTPPPCFDNTSTYPLTNRPMFRVQGGAERVRFRDIWLYSRSSGDNCFPRGDLERIAEEETVAIELNTEYAPSCEKDPCPYAPGDIKDVIFENVSITSFTHAIKAVSLDGEENLTDHEISNVRIRAFRPEANHRQLTVNSKYAYDWDVQNFNITWMGPDQGGIDLINTGHHYEYGGPNPGFKFTHLNCNGDKNRENSPEFCVQVQKHGGLYFRQLHHEGAPFALKVLDISGRLTDNTNPDPVVFESSGASGDFNDGSMQLYTIGTGIGAPSEVAFGMDDGRMRFNGNAVNATVVDCGDVHSDWTDIRPQPVTTKPDYPDLPMIWSHNERNRSSLFAKDSFNFEYQMPHTYCPENTAQKGAILFDSGVLPTGGGIPYSKTFNASCGLGASACLQSLMDGFGVVYIPAGSFTFTDEVNVPKGVIVIGATDPDDTLLSELSFNPTLPDKSLFKTVLPVPGDRRVSGINIRNLKLKKTSTNSNAGTTGISLIGDTCPVASCDPGESSDMHFSGLSFQGFDTGFYAGFSPTAHAANPMIDGLSVKNMSFTNNLKAVDLNSQNLSNWNVMNIDIKNPNVSNALGWYQDYGGNVGIQKISCSGAESKSMKDCVRLRMSSVFINDMKKASWVDNAITVDAGGTVNGNEYVAYWPSHIVIRNSDFTPSTGTTAKLKVDGKSFITSMGNKYDNSGFTFGSAAEGDKSRVTWCDDTYTTTPSPAFSGLADTHKNLWVGVETPTRVHCGTRPMPFDDAVRWGDAYNSTTSLSTDVPFVGNFYDNVKDDFVYFRGPISPDTNNHFHIKKWGTANDKMDIPWGIAGDKPFVGNFVGNKSQVGIFRPSDKTWWIYDPNTTSYFTFGPYGLATDKILVGNFFDETGSADKDEIALYRDNTTYWEYWVINPITLETRHIVSYTNYGDNIVIGDFDGSGHDQAAHFHIVVGIGKWDTTDLDTGTNIDNYTFGVDGDVPVAGRYLGPSSGLAPQCSQLGVWSPVTQMLAVRDGGSTCGTRGTSTAIEMLWGSNNDYYGATSYADDIQFAMTGSTGLARPTVYRPTRGIYTRSIANGQWFVHDEFP